MEIKKKLKKHLPVSSNTFNEKIDNLITEVEKVYNNQLYYNYQISSIRSELIAYVNEQNNIKTDIIDSLFAIKNTLEIIKKTTDELPLLLLENDKKTLDLIGAEKNNLADLLKSNILEIYSQNLNITMLINKLKNDLKIKDDSTNALITNKAELLFKKYEDQTKLIENIQNRTEEICIKEKENSKQICSIYNIVNKFESNMENYYSEELNKQFNEVSKITASIEKHMISLILQNHDQNSAFYMEQKEKLKSFSQMMVEFNKTFTDDMQLINTFYNNMDEKNIEIKNCVIESIKQMNNILTNINMRSERVDNFIAANKKDILNAFNNLQTLNNDQKQVFNKLITFVPDIKESILNIDKQIKTDEAKFYEEILNTISKLNTDFYNKISEHQDDNQAALIKASEKRMTNRSNHNIMKHLWELAANQTAEYVTEYMAKCTTYKNPDILREKAVSKIEIEGLFLEFGVFSGKSINQVADLLPKQVIYGFDSFKGLPETWRTGFYKDKFICDELPEVRSNVNLVVGMFEDTLPNFVQQHTEPCAYIHIDCDLYSSTKTVFNYLKDKIVPGTVIVFDEFFNYPSWKEHEYRAFHEFVNETGISYEYIGYVPDYEQVAIIIR